LYLVQEKHRPTYTDITYVYVYLFCPFDIEVSSSNYKQLRATNTNELDRMCKEASTAYIEVTFRSFTAVAEENDEIYVRIAVFGRRLQAGTSK